MKMAESSRSISAIKKKIKRSKLAETTTLKFEWTTLKDNFKIWMEKNSFMTNVPNVIASRRYSWNCSYYIIFCDIIKCAVFLINMKFAWYLKVVNNKSIMFNQLITVGIWKVCIVGNLSDESHSNSAARFCCIICVKTWSQLKTAANILLSKFWGIKGSFNSVNFWHRDFFVK